MVPSEDIVGAPTLQAAFWVKVPPMNTSPWRLGWRTLWRDLRAGELRLLIVAVTLAVAALTAVGFFADRLKGGLARDARQLLGGDAVVSSDNPTPQAFIDRARALGLQATGTLGFPTMGRAGEAQGGASKLVALKVVDTGYPLRGSLRVAPAPETPGQTTRDIPAAARPGSTRRCWTRWA
jgi:putative ABC transport system permease protein